MKSATTNTNNEIKEDYTTVARVFTETSKRKEHESSILLPAFIRDAKASAPTHAYINRLQNEFLYSQNKRYLNVTDKDLKLRSAVEKGDIDRVEELLSEGANPNNITDANIAILYEKALNVSTTISLHEHNIYLATNNGKGHEEQDIRHRMKASLPTYYIKSYQTLKKLLLGQSSTVDNFFDHLDSPDIFLDFLSNRRNFQCERVLTKKDSKEVLEKQSANNNKSSSLKLSQNTLLPTFQFSFGNQNQNLFTDAKEKLEGKLEGLNSISCDPLGNVRLIFKNTFSKKYIQLWNNISGISLAIYPDNCIEISKHCSTDVFNKMLSSINFKSELTKDKAATQVDDVKSGQPHNKKN